MLKNKTFCITHPSVSSKLKRAIDILGALIGLSITALLFLPIAVLILLDNPGPILFYQTRIGWRGKRFQIWKFRSMFEDAERYKHLVPNQAQGPIFKNENDPRVTRVGRFLRRASIDEFPQFWNVLRGDMSLVGTRPPEVGEVERYTPHHWRRLEVKPGLTGEWQVKGRSAIDNFEEIVQLDLDYQRHWSVTYDLYLMWQTILVVLKRTGAY